MGASRIFLYLLPTVFLVVIGQFLMKWRTSLNTTQAAADFSFRGMLQYLTDPWICLAYVAALLGSIFWMYAVGKLPLSIAFPVYQGMVFLAVALGGWALFGEAFTLPKATGIVLIFLGIVLIAWKS